MELTHLDKNGNAVMVDVSEKEVTHRTAIACGKILVSQEILASIKENTNKKGDVLAVARVAGIMAAKRTSELIPLCHLLMLTKCTVDFTINEEENYIEASCTVKTDGKTGVEMEALTAVSTAALTVYDMCKAVQKDMVITDIRLLSKTGGVHGDYFREEN